MKDIKTNGGGTNPLKNILQAGIVEAITARKDALKLSGLIPILSDVENLDVTSKEVVWNVYEGDGKALVTDAIPNTVPALTLSSERKNAKMKWISFGIEVTEEQKGFFNTGKLKFKDSTSTAMRVIETEEESFLKASLAGMQSKYGINVSSASSGHWDTLTGVALIKEIRKHIAAHTAGEKFEARTLWVDKKLYDVLKNPYSEAMPKSYLQILLEDKDFTNVVSIPNLGAVYIVDDRPENFGRVVETPLRLQGPYSVERIDKYVVELHTSEIVVKQPRSITKIEGAM